MESRWPMVTRLVAQGWHHSWQLRRLYAGHWRADLFRARG